MVDILDRTAAAAGQALREVAWDREHGIPHTTPDMLRKVASVVMLASEAYGVRSCGTCTHWTRHAPDDYWGSCRLAVEPHRQPPALFCVFGEKAELTTNVRHGCRGWQGCNDAVGGTEQEGREEATAAP